MKFSESWLKEWTDPALTREALCDKLTMSGLEVEEVTPVAEPFSHVFIAEVLEIVSHPDANHLHICKVTTGKETLQIVCGAPNVKPHLKVALAVVGAQLPNHKHIHSNTLRGVESQGMLCSASELSLTETESDEILELASNAPVGMPFWDYLQLSDHIIDLAITPNRGDCLSIKGIAREVAALTNAPFKASKIAEVPAKSTATLPVTLHAPTVCPRYVGRVIQQVRADTSIPSWLVERLRRSGVRSISPIVDVTNYVMLELGQPMHAFDLNKIEKRIHVRFAKKGEHITLLDGSEQTLDAETLVIADQQQPLAIAGVMGGMESCVTLLTQDIFLESAYFTPKVVARQRQHYGLSSESAYRFERSIDPALQREAIERATALIIDITGGIPGPVIEEKNDTYCPKPVTLQLAKHKITNVLGMTLSDNEINSIFERLGFTYHFHADNWNLTIPSHRPDIQLPEDVIEEIARLHGYQHIPTHPLIANLQANHNEENSQDMQLARQTLANLDYHEIISYSFIDKQLQQQLDPAETAYELVNPITADMTVMRTSLWPGLISTLLYNASRQQQRIRLFEIGNCFLLRNKQVQHQPLLSGVVTGFAQAEQWGIPNQEADFYHVKGDIETLLSMAFGYQQLTFKPIQHPVLHPGQSAAVYFNDKKLGMLGALHPSLCQALELPKNVFLFEIDLKSTSYMPFHALQEVSKFPEIRRDVAILLNQTIPAKDIQDTIKDVAGDWLKESFIFDVYQGKGVPSGFKSVALALVLQHPSRTLVDQEIAQLVERVITALKERLGADLRS